MNPLNFHRIGFYNGGMDVEEISKKRKTGDDLHHPIVKKAKSEAAILGALDEKFRQYPAFFQIDQTDICKCLEGQLSYKQTDMILWKLIYRIYAVYTFFEMEVDYLSLSDFAKLKTIMNLISSTHSKAYRAACSLVQKLETMGSLPPMTSLKFLSNDIEVDDKLLTHVLLDKYGSNSGFEGMTTLKPLQFAIKCFENQEIISMIGFLTNENMEEKQNEILRLTRSAEKFEILINKSFNNDFLSSRNALPQFVITFTEKLRDTLKQDKSVLLAGGWTASTSGHTIYYKIEQQNDDRYTFFVFNRGAGAGRNGAVYKGNHEAKFRRPSFLCIKNIEKENLFDEIFIQGLIELCVFKKYLVRRSHGDQTPDTSYSEQTLYDGLLPLLKGEIVLKEDMDSLELMSEQISGTCSWKSLTAFLRHELTYPQFRLWITLVKETALLNYFSRNLKTLEGSKALFEKSLESFSSTLKKMSFDIPLKAEDDEQFKMHLDFLYDALEQVEINALEGKKVKKKGTFVKSFPQYTKMRELAKIYDLESNRVSQESISKYNGGLFETIRTKVWDSATLNADLSSLFQEMKTLLNNNECRQVFCVFIETMLHLPHFKNDFWTHFDPNATKELMITLSELQRLFYQSSDHYDTLGLAKTFKTVAALYKGLAIQDRLIEGRVEDLDMGGLDRPPDYRELEFLLDNPKANYQFGHYSSTLFQSAFLREPKVLDELESIYAHFNSRFESKDGKSMLFFRPGSIEGNDDDREDETDKPRKCTLISKYENKELKDQLNPEIQYIINILNRLTADQVAEIEALDESHISQKYVQEDKFKDYDMTLKVCLVLAHDSIAEKILPPHVFSYRKQVERTWFLMHNITNRNDVFNQKLKIKKNQDDELKLEYKLFSKVRSKTNRTISGKGIAFYLENISEKKVLIDVFSNYKCGSLSNVEIKEIKHILYADNLKISNVLSYFTKYPEKLDDPNYRIFLNLILFERDFLIKEFKDNPYIIEIFSSFITKAYERAKHLNDLNAVCDILVLGCTFSRYCLFAEAAVDPSRIQRAIDILKEMQRSGADSGERINIARSIIVCMGHKSHLDVSDVQDLLYCHKISCTSGSPIKGIDPFIFEEVERVLWKFLPQIDALISKNLGFIFSTFAEDVIWEKLSFGVYKTSDQSSYIDIVKGIYKLYGGIETTMPKQILSNDKYTRLFPELLPVTNFLNDEGSLVYQIVKNGEKYSISIVEGNLKIQKEQEGIIKTLYNEHELRSDFEILDSWNTWIYKNGTSFILEVMDEKDKLVVTICADLDENTELYKITAKKEGMQLLELDAKNNVEYQSLYAFCDAKKIMVFGHDVPLLIEIPSHRLTFTAESHGFNQINFICKEYPGFYLDRNQHIEPLEKLSFDAYIVLRDALGNKKVIVNVQRKILKDCKKSHYILDYNIEERDNKRHLTAHGRVEKLVLAAIAIYSRIPSGYILARQLLEKHPFIIEETDIEEFRILNSILKIPCKGDPREISLKLTAIYTLLIASNNPKHEDKLSKFQFTDDLYALLVKYAKTYRQNPGFQLTPEIFVRLYMRIAPIKILHEADVVILLKTLYPELESNDLIQFLDAVNISSLNEFNQKTCFSNNKFDCPGYFWYLKYNEKESLVTKQDYDGFFWHALHVLSNSIDDDSVTNLRKQITLLNGDKDARHILRALDCLSSNWKNQEVRLFLENFKKESFENDKFEVKGKFTNTLNDLIIKYPSLNPIKGLPIKKIYVQPSQIVYPKLRPCARIPFSPPISTGYEFLQKRSSFAIHHKPEMHLTRPSFQKYFTKKKAHLESPLVQVEKETLEKTALQVLDLKITSSLSQKVTEELNKGIIQCCSLNEPLQLHFDMSSLPFLIEELKGYIKEKKSEMAPLKLYLANYARSQSSSLDIESLRMENEQGSPVNLKVLDLIFFYAREDLSSLLAIEEEGVLNKKITEFLTKATEIQKWQRCYEKALQIREKPQEAITLIKELERDFKAKRIFVPSLSPAVLTLEYIGNILVREEQFEKCKTLNESTNCILQMIPGSGKTSILIKLLAFLNADGKKLSCVLLPEELFQSMQEEIIEGGSSFFNQLIVPLSVSRERCISLKYLEDIRVELREIIRKKGAVITSPVTIHTIYLQFIEAIYLQKMDHAEVLKDILNIFKNESRVLFDEIDLILEIKKFINFSLGDALGLNSEDMILSSHIHEILLGSPEITEALKFKFSKENARENAKLFTKEIYTQFKPLLAKKILLHLQEEYEELKLKTQEEQKAIEAFLIHDSVNDAHYGFHVINQLTTSALKNCLGLAKEQINTLLPSTLIFNCNEHYGFSNEIQDDLVIPYEKGNPIEGSRFGHPHEAVNYTLQTALFGGITENALNKTLQLIKEEIIKDMLLGMHPENTAGYRRFKELWRGDEKINPLAVNKEQFHRIKKGIEDSSEITLAFTTKYLLPLIKFDSRKLSSPAGMLYFLFGKEIEGFSGTLGNSDTFPIGVNSHPEPIIDGKTICLLVKHFLDNRNDTLVIEEETEGAVFEGIKCVQDVSALIDGGGYLNQESPESLAEKWLKKSSLPILCHDSKGTLFLKTNDGNKTPGSVKIEPHARLTIYRQPYTTGTDIPQSPNGVGVITISRNVQLRDIIQNVRRMRQLDSNQRIRFMLTKDVLELIASTLGIDPVVVNTIYILKFALINQVKQLEEDAVKSRLQQIQTAATSAVLESCLEALSLKELTLTPLIEALFAPKNTSAAWEMYGSVSEEKETALILKEESERVLSSLKEALQNSTITLDLSEIQERIEELNNTTLLPLKSIMNSSKEMHTQVKVQTKLQTQIQEAPKVMVLNEQPVNWMLLDWEDHAYAHTTDTLSFNFLNFLAMPSTIPSKGPFSFYPFQQYFPFLFTNKLMISTNLALPQGFKANSTVPFSQNQKIFGHALIIQHDQGESIVLIDADDVYIAKILERFPANCCLYNLVLGFERTGSRFDMMRIISDEGAHLTLLQARLLAGFWQFNDEEMAVLKRWIQYFNYNAMETYFKNTIFKNYLEADLLCARLAELFK